MKKSIRLLPIAILLCAESWSSVSAAPSQTLVLKDGSVLEGYIARQRPGDNMEFATERADFYLPSDGTQIIEHTVRYADLNDAWREWAEHNDVLEGIGDGRTLTLSDLLTSDGRNVRGVRVLERGAHVRYLELTPNSYSVSWDTIQTVRVTPRVRTALSGIDRTYTLSSGAEYEGQYVEEVPGKTLSLLKNGVIEVFDTEKVVRYVMKPVNSNQTLFEQSDLLDEVVRRDGSVARGIIVERNYTSPNPDDNFVVIQYESGNDESFRMKDIEEYHKLPNEKFTPVYDILLNQGDVVFNREVIDVTPVTESGSSLYLESDSSSLVISRERGKAILSIENRPAPGAEIKVVKMQTSKSKNKKNLFGFTYKDLAHAFIPVSVTTSVNLTTKAVYEFDESATYIAYESSTGRAWVFSVK